MITSRKGLRPLKSPYSVLSQKEEQLARVRREIEALIVVIPLLVEEEDQKRIEQGMAHLEVYFPFTRNLPSPSFFHRGGNGQMRFHRSAGPARPNSGRGER